MTTDLTVDGLSGYVTVAAAAKALGISVSGVHQIIRRKKVPVVRVGWGLLVRLSDLLAAR